MENQRVWISDRAINFKNNKKDQDRARNGLAWVGYIQQRLSHDPGLEELWKMGMVWSSLRQNHEAQRSLNEAVLVLHFGSEREQKELRNVLGVEKGLPLSFEIRKVQQQWIDQLEERIREKPEAWHALLRSPIQVKMVIWEGDKTICSEEKKEKLWVHEVAPKELLKTIGAVGWSQEDRLSECLEVQEERKGSNGHYFALLELAKAREQDQAKLSKVGWRTLWGMKERDCNIEWLWGNAQSIALTSKLLRSESPEEEEQRQQELKEHLWNWGKNYVQTISKEQRDGFAKNIVNPIMWSPLRRRMNAQGKVSVLAKSVSYGNVHQSIGLWEEAVLKESVNSIEELKSLFEDLFEKTRLDNKNKDSKEKQTIKEIPDLNTLSSWDALEQWLEKKLEPGKKLDMSELWGELILEYYKKRDVQAVTQLLWSQSEGTSNGLLGAFAVNQDQTINTMLNLRQKMKEIMSKENGLNTIEQANFIEKIQKNVEEFKKVVTQRRAIMNTIEEKSPAKEKEQAFVAEGRKERLRL